MKREDAYYFKILLSFGFFDGYNQWLDSFLEVEDPLSDIVLELALCRSDANKTISCLHNYCAAQTFDEKAVCDKLRIFLRDAHYSNRLSKEETASYMYHFALCHGDPADGVTEFWGDMYYMDDYYSLAKDGIISWKNFDLAFYSYLDGGIPVDTQAIWNKRENKIEVLFSKIKRLFSNN